MQTKQTPFFSFILAFFLIITLISKDLGLIGVIVHYLFIYILAFFAPFISKKHLLIIWGLMFSVLTFNNTVIVMPLIAAAFPTMRAYVYSLPYFVMLESSSLFFMGLTYILALHRIKRKKIRERVGKCFRI